MFGIIYKITNLVNNKIYIGQTVQRLNKRFWRHIHESKNLNTKMVISKAIRKYGSENFIIEEIDKAYSREELNGLEARYIQEYKSFHRKIGYNICVITNNHICATQETKDKMRKRMLEPNNLEKTTQLGKNTRGTKRKYSSSKYIGVKRYKDRWRADINFEGKRIHIGIFDNEIDAAKAFDKVAKQKLGHNAKLNFLTLSKVVILFIFLFNTGYSQNITKSLRNAEVSVIREFPRININTIPATSPWTYPGEITDHLLHGHGLTLDQIRHLSQAEKVKLHNYLHNTTKQPVNKPRRFRLFR